VSIIVFKEKEDGRINMLLSGPVTQEPQLSQKQDKVRFSMSYGKKKYMSCEVFTDSPLSTIAGCLEKGDYVTVMGTWREWEYNDKKYSNVTVDGLIAPQMPSVAPKEPPKANASSDIPPGFTEESEEDDGQLPF